MWIEYTINSYFLQINKREAELALIKYNNYFYTFYTITRRNVLPKGLNW